MKNQIKEYLEIFVKVKLKADVFYVNNSYLGSMIGSFAMIGNNTRNLKIESVSQSLFKDFME